MNQVRVQDHATIVILNCAFSWGTITDNAITTEVNNDNHTTTKALRVRKTLLPAHSGVYVDAVRTALGAFYQYHTSRSYATPIKGQRLMPVAFYPDYMERYGEAHAKANVALDALVAGYPAAVEQAKLLLVDAFNAADYPDAEEIRNYFTLDVRFLPVPAGDHIMNALGAGVAANVDSFATQIMDTAAADAKKRLRDAVARMAERLAVKGSRLFTTMTDAIDELAETLPALAGLTNDPELQRVIQEVKDTLTGYDPETFKKNDVVRSQVGAAAADILKRMGG